MVTDVLKWMAAFITATISSLGYFGVFLLMAIESAAIPLPSEIIMPFSGYLVFRQEFTLHGAAFWGAAGCVAGSWAAYAVAARGGRPLVERYGRYVFISRHDLDLADRLFTRYGSPIIFFSRLMPVVRTFISLPAGLARMPLMRFSLYTFLGSYPFCYALAYFGYKTGEHWHTLESTFRKYDILIGVLFLVGAAWWVRRHLVPARTGPEGPR
ncbi:MAG: alkaline phosphatase [Acidobacteria bacterium]|nr:MAG: alkaline phosphatase [Acidobacteria bacterium 13_1_40CM_2_68_10]OLE64692.1 MAG: alkaline phosphatase [Acidobacteria bacterium 13_1_20CM_2_68_14]PYT37560.1 MAG: alkaline phosphatase [Acidobacteriota bacterium]